MKFDPKNSLSVEPSILPQAATGNVNGLEVDIQGFNKVALLGFLDDAATGSFKIQESDTSGSGYTDVAAADIIGTNDVAGVASDIVTIGYIGTKRYLRAVFTHTGSGDISACFNLSCPDVGKTSANS